MGASLYSKMDEWILLNIKCSVCVVPQKGLMVVVDLVSNSTAIQGVFKRMAEYFTAMSRHMLFVEWITNNINATFAISHQEV